MKKETLAKSQKYCQEYPDEFFIATDNNLYCNICNVKVLSERKCTVVLHRASKKHTTGLDKISKEKKPNKQTFIPGKSDDTLIDLICKALLSSNTPLDRLNNPDIQSLFKYINVPLPSVTQLRLYILNKYQNKQQKKFIDLFKDEKLF